MIWQTLKTNEMTNHKFYSQSSVWFERHWLEHSFCSNRCELRGRDIQMLTWEMGGRQFMDWLRSVEGVSFKFIWVHTAGLHPAWGHCFTSRRRGRSWLIFITVLNKFCLVCSNTYGKGLLKADKTQRVPPKCVYFLPKCETAGKSGDKNVLPAKCNYFNDHSMKNYLARLSTQRLELPTATRLLNRQMNAWTAGRKSLKILRPVIKYFACPCPPLYKCQDQWICTKFAPSCIRCTRVLLWACELFTASVGGSTMCALSTWEHFLLNLNIHPSVQLRYNCEVLIPNTLLGLRLSQQVSLLTTEQVG